MLASCQRLKADLILEGRALGGYNWEDTSFEGLYGFSTRLRLKAGFFLPLLGNFQTRTGSNFLATAEAIFFHQVTHRNLVF